MKRVLLEIYVDVSEKTGNTIVNWDYKESVKAWFMVGILETIKKELLEEDEVSYKEEQEK